MQKLCEYVEQEKEEDVRSWCDARQLCLWVHLILFSYVSTAAKRNKTVYERQLSPDSLLE